jgi:hypothetical protein
MSGRLLSARDPRIDFLRGFALLTIFIDHVPGNFLGTLTLRNFGFSDAAELFVLLAGLSSALAYGRQFDTGDAGPAVRRVALRCLRIYLFQIGLLVTTLAILSTWLPHFGLEPHGIWPLLHGGVRGLGHGLALHALPSNLNILPLYIVLLALFPLMYLAARRYPWAMLGGSACVWLAANLDHDLNLPNWMDGRGWFFNPFAWQFLFALGVVGARFFLRNGPALPRLHWLTGLCLAYLAFGVLAAAPWSNWGWSWAPLSWQTDKTSLSPFRLLHVLALIYLMMTAGWFRRLVDRPALAFVPLCGRHSLEVFATGTLLSLLGRLVFRTFGISLETQLLVNAAGLACMLAVAAVLEARKARLHPGRMKMQPS